MTWLQDAKLWIAAVISAVLVAWIRNLLSALLPGPQRTLLALKNLALPELPSRRRVRFVLAWLDNDHKGNNTKAVSAMFTDVEDIELCRSARIVSASGAADAWRPAMKRKAKDLLRAWHADIAVFGRVDKDAHALSLWFFTSDDSDTLADSFANPYALHLNRLPDQFFDHLRVQIRTVVLALTIPKTNDENTRFIGLRDLAAAVPKLENLFRTFTATEDRAPLSSVYHLAQSSLGEWLGEPERLRLALEKTREFTDEEIIPGNPNTLLANRVNRARTLYLLAERKADVDQLELRAIAAMSGES